MVKRLDDFRLTRRQMLIGTGATAGSIILPFGAIAAEEDTPTTTLKTLDNLYCVYVNRATGRVEFVKTFADVNPEIKEGKTAAIPYRAPNKNVYIGNAPTVFKQDVKRYAIVDIEKRNEGLGWFSSLKDSYLPQEYTHHFLLTLSDRELGREELGGWALNTATAAQKKTAMDLLYRIHKGLNGQYITDDPDKMAEATRFYTGRELLKPMLYLGQPPKVGDLAMIGTGGIQVASNGPVQIAQFLNEANSGAVTSGINITADSPMSNDISVAAKGATEGISAVGASIGNAASVGASGGGSSGAGDGGSGSGGGSSGGGSSGGSGAGPGGGSSGSGDGGI